MDFNRLEAQYLVSRGILSTETVEGALQLMATQPATDLLECVARQGLLSPAQAQGIRNEIQLHQSNPAFNPGSGLHPSYSNLQPNALNQGSGAHPGVGQPAPYHPGSGVHPGYQQVQQAHVNPNSSSSSVIRTIAQPGGPLLAASGQVPVQHFQAPPQSPASSSYAPALNRSSGMTSTGPREFIGHYKLEGEIGRGGMGAVYRAFCSKLKREVAIKTMTLEGSDASVALQRFQREAAAMARLSHPNIVTVHDFGEDNGVHYLVMDLIEGASLKEIIQKEGQFEEKEAARLIMKIARALDYSHKHTILHRDIKPANVFVLKDGNEPLLGDFGLAKDTGDDEQFNLTKSHQFLGTPVYMSPEQADGNAKELDHRADIYSLGVTLYEMLTGGVPFKGGNITNLIHAILTKDPEAPTKLRPGLNQDIESICLKCIEKDVMARYWSAGALAEDLLNFLHDRPVRAKPLDAWEKARRWSAKHTWIVRSVAVGFLVILLSLGGYTGYQEWTDLSQKSRVANLRINLERTAEQKHKDLSNRLEKLYSSIPNEAVADNDGATRTRLERDLQRAESIAKESLAFDEKAEWVEGPLTLLSGLNEDSDVDKFRARIRETFRPLYIASRAAYIKGQIYSKLGDVVRGAGERARSFKLDSTGFFGEKAYLEIATSLLAQEEYLSASPIFKELAGNKHSPRVKAYARFGLATIAVNAGLFADARVLLNSEEDLKNLDAADRKIAKWYLSLSKVYQGRGVWQRNPKFDIAFTPYQWEGCRIVIRVAPWGTRQRRAKEKKNNSIELCKVRVKGSKIELELIGEIDSDGLVRDFRFLHYQEQSMLLIRDRKKAYSIYKFSSGRFVKERTLPKRLIPNKFSPQLLGDFDGNGEADLVLFGAKRGAVLFNFQTNRSRFYEIPGLVGSSKFQGQAIDLNEDGADDLVVSLGKWHHFSILAYKGEKGRQAFSKPVRKLVGECSGMIARHAPGQRPEVLVASDRRIMLDIGVLFGPDLSPQLPDAVWRVRLEDDEFVFEKVMSTKFEDREKLAVADIHTNKDLDKLYPNSFAVRLKDGLTEEVRFCSGESALPIVRLKGEYSRIRTLDIDLDGEPELLLRSFNEIRVLGLKANAKKRSLEEIISNQGNTDQISLAINFLEAQRPKAAEQILGDLLQDKTTGTMTRITARLALARCLAARQEWPLAREICQDLARRYSSVRKSAYLQAAQYAEDSENFEGAVRDLRDLLEVMPKRGGSFNHERVRIEKRMVALRELTKIKPLIKLNPKWWLAQRRSGLSFESGMGVFCEVTDDALVMTSRSDSGVYLRLPLTYSGQSFRFKGRLRLNWMDGRAHLNFRFVEKNSSTPFFFNLEFLVNSQGGDALSWRRAIDVDYSGSKGSYVNTTFTRRVLFQQFRPDENVEFELFYREDQRSLVLRLRHGSRTVDRFFPLRQGLNSGAYQLEIKSWNSKNRLKPIEKNSSQVEIYELSFHAPSDAISIDQSVTRNKLAEANYHFVRRDLERAEKLAKAWLNESPATLAVDRCQATFLLALIKSRLGMNDRAREFLKEAKNHSREEFEELWRNALPLLKSNEHQLLVDVLGLKRSGRQLNDSLRNCVATKKPDWERAALLHFGAGPRGMGHPQAGVAWLFSGHFDLAEKLLKSTQGQKNPKANFYLGLLAYKRRRYKKVLDLWKDVKWKQRNEIPMFQDFYIRSQYLVNHVGKESK